MSSTKIILNSDNVLRALQAQLTAEMQAAAEPLIQQAIKDAEVVIRKRTAAMLVGMVEKTVSMQRFGQDLRIVVEGFGK